MSYFCLLPFVVRPLTYQMLI